MFLKISKWYIDSTNLFQRCVSIEKSTRGLYWATVMSIEERGSWRECLEWSSEWLKTIQNLKKSLVIFYNIINFVFKWNSFDLFTQNHHIQNELSFSTIIFSEHILNGAVFQWLEKWKKYLEDVGQFGANKTTSHLLNQIQGANLSSFSNDKLIKFPAKRKRSNIRTFTVDKFLDILQRIINISIGYTSIFFSKNTKKTCSRHQGSCIPVVM